MFDAGARDRKGEHVTAASPISDPTSMWSGPMECRAEPSVVPPSITIVLVPMPSIFAPSFHQEMRKILHMGFRRR